MNADISNGMARSPRKRSRERGTALIEFTLVLPLLLVLTVAAVDFGRAFFVKNMLHQSAREGVRMLAVQAHPDSVRARARQVAGASGVTLSTIVLNGAAGPKQVSVTVQTDFNWSFPGVFNLFGAGFTNPTQLAATAVMREE
jgi:Flp pilus assembly protein TadG